MTIAFKKAVRGKGRRLKVAIDGVSGSGKTFTALRLAHQIVAAGHGKRIAVIDTERGSASLYASESPDGTTWDYDSAELTDYSPSSYADAIAQATKAGYDVVVIDSLSHAWVGPGGAIEIADRAGQQSHGGNKWAGWSKATPVHNQMVEAIIQSAAHVIATMRVKAEWTEQENASGKKTYVRSGTNAVQRDGMEYEFDVHARMDESHTIVIEKTRCVAMDGRTATKPGPSFWQPLLDWWSGGNSAPVARQPEGGQHSSAAEKETPYRETEAKLAGLERGDGGMVDLDAIMRNISDNKDAYKPAELAQLRTRCKKLLDKYSTATIPATNTAAEDDIAA